MGYPFWSYHLLHPKDHDVVVPGNVILPQILPIELGLPENASFKCGQP